MGYYNNNWERVLHNCFNLHLARAVKMMYNKITRIE